jgi:hypothetical protein
MFQFIVIIYCRRLWNPLGTYVSVCDQTHAGRTWRCIYVILYMQESWLCSYASPIHSATTLRRGHILELARSHSFCWRYMLLFACLHLENLCFTCIHCFIQFSLSGNAETRRERIDHLRNRLNFDLNKSRQKFHHSLKEHHKISNIPKFRCEML